MTIKTCKAVTRIARLAYTKSDLQVVSLGMFPDLEWSDFRSPLYFVVQIVVSIGHSHVFYVVFVPIEHIQTNPLIPNMS